MKPIEIDDSQQTTLAAIELEICDAIDEYNDAVASGNDELAQMMGASHLCKYSFHKLAGSNVSRLHEQYFYESEMLPK